MILSKHLVSYCACLRVYRYSNGTHVFTVKVLNIYSVFSLTLSVVIIDFVYFMKPKNVDLNVNYNF